MNRVQQFLRARHGSGPAPARSQNDAALEQQAEAVAQAPHRLPARDFAGVRVHNDAEAHESADALGARAFTCGQDLYFGSGQLAPQTADGRELIAHEMAHVAQQAEQGAALQFDPKQSKAGIGAMPPEEYFIKDPDNWGVEDDFLLFQQDEATLDGGDEKTIRDFAAKQDEAVKIFVHAYASQEGPADYNLNISAHRGVAVKKLLEGLLPPKSEVTVFAHGESKHFGATPTNRRVGLSLVGPVEPQFKLQTQFQVGRPFRRTPVPPGDVPGSLPDPWTYKPKFSDDPILTPPALDWRNLPSLFAKPRFDLMDLAGLGAPFALHGTTAGQSADLFTDWGRAFGTFRNWGLSDDLAAKAANLSLSMAYQAYFERDQPNVIDKSNADWKASHPDETRIPPLPLISSDSLEFVYEKVTGRKRTYKFHF